MCAWETHGGKRVTPCGGLELRLNTILLGFPGSSDSKESACNVVGPSSVPGSGRVPGEGHGYPLQ